MTLYLGIDGGGTGCRAAVADSSGQILGRGQGGPANITSDPEGARLCILQAGRMALQQAVGADGVAAAEPALMAGLGLAGANAAGVAGKLRLGLPYAGVRIETDAVTAAMGALGPQDGIVAALGTGSVFAVQQAGQIRQFGGWGLVLGDEGSGAWLGRALLARALRATDGFAEGSPLLAQVLDELGGPAATVSFARNASPADFARFAPRLIDSDDPAALAIMGQAIGDVGAMLAHLHHSTPLPITFIGGLGPVYASRLTVFAQRPALGTALDGALHLARKAA